MIRTRMLGLLVLLTAIIGCNRSFYSPRDLRGSPRPDQSSLSIAEQERLGRARYGLHDDDFRVGPKTYTDRPGPTGVGY